MKKIYAVLSLKALILFLSFGLLSATAIAQVCGGVVENFNGAGSTGFTGDFSPEAGKLVRHNVVGTAIYSITTPTYQLAAANNTIGYGFVLDGTEQVARVEVVIVYISTLTNQPITVFLNQFVPNYGGGTSANVCRAVSTDDLPGFPSGGKYRLRIDLTGNTGVGQFAQTITFDDFKTTGTQALTPLPVSFIGFEAKKTASGAMLTWKVAGEENVNHYEVERSADGRSFTSVYTAAITKRDTYTYMDANASSTAYYRIKNVDNDGKFKYSNIARIVNGKSSIVISAFPQPVVGQLTVQHPAAKATGLLTITSADGRILSATKPTTGSMQTFVDMTNLQKGLYVVRFDDGDGNTETMKVIKQ